MIAYVSYGHRGSHFLDRFRRLIVERLMWTPAIVVLNVAFQPGDGLCDCLIVVQVYLFLLD